MADFDIDDPLYLSDETVDAFISGFWPVSWTGEVIASPPSAPAISSQNVLISDYGGTIFDILRQHAPHWYQVACEAYLAMYAWHGTMDSRPLLQPLAGTMIGKAVESFTVIDPTWSLEDTPILLGNGNGWCTTSFQNPVFMDALKRAVTAAQDLFYSRTFDVVRFLVLPCHAMPWTHPGIIPGATLATADQRDYAKNLVVWNPSTGHNLWHDIRPDESGVMTLYWFDRPALKYLIETVHFDTSSPGYLYLQRQVVNPYSGLDEWGPLSSATLHSTAWILATIYVYLWADILGNQRFMPGRFTSSRGRAILTQQAKISIFLKQVLRKRVPGLTAEQSEGAYIGLHQLMRTDPNTQFQT